MLPSQQLLLPTTTWVFMLPQVQHCGSTQVLLPPLPAGLIPQLHSPTMLPTQRPTGLVPLVWYAGTLNNQVHGQQLTPLKWTLRSLWLIKQQSLVSTTLTTAQFLPTTPSRISTIKPSRMRTPDKLISSRTPSMPQLPSQLDHASQLKQSPGGELLCSLLMPLLPLLLPGLLLLILPALHILSVMLIPLLPLLYGPLKMVICTWPPMPPQLPPLLLLVRPSVSLVKVLIPCQPTQLHSTGVPRLLVTPRLQP